MNYRDSEQRAEIARHNELSERTHGAMTKTPDITLPEHVIKNLEEVIDLLDSHIECVNSIHFKLFGTSLPVSGELTQVAQKGSETKIEGAFNILRLNASRVRTYLQSAHSIAKEINDQI